MIKSKSYTKYRLRYTNDNEGTGRISLPLKYNEDDLWEVEENKLYKSIESISSLITSLSDTVLEWRCVNSDILDGLTDTGDLDSLQDVCDLDVELKHPLGNSGLGDYIPDSHSLEPSDEETPPHCARHDPQQRSRKVPLPIQTEQLEYRAEGDHRTLGQGFETFTPTDNCNEPWTQKAKVNFPDSLAVSFCTTKKRKQKNKRQTASNQSNQSLIQAFKSGRESIEIPTSDNKGHKYIISTSSHPYNLWF